MNRLVILYGCVLLSSTAIAEVQQSVFDTSPLQEALSTEEMDTILVSPTNDKMDETTLVLSNIEFIEEEDLELGFDTKDYLPDNFDPHRFYFNMESVVFLEEEQELDLGFETSAYLPNEFDPYTETLTVGSINFMEEENIDLGFDTKDYLPEGFSPYEFYIDLNSIIYIEMDEWDNEISICPWVTTSENKLYK